MTEQKCVGGHVIPIGMPYRTTPEGDICQDCWRKKEGIQVLTVEAALKDKAPEPKTETLKLGEIGIIPEWELGRNKQFRAEFERLRQELELQKAASACVAGSVTKQEFDERCHELNAKFAELENQLVPKGGKVGDLISAHGADKVSQAAELLGSLDELKAQNKPNRAVLANPHHAMRNREIEKAGFAAGIRAVEDLLGRAGRGEPLPNGNGSRFKWSIPFDGQAA